MRVIIILLFITGLIGCNNFEKEKTLKQVKRYGWVIKVKPDKLDEYKRLHANPWPGVNAMLKACNIQNYSIFHRDGLLFSYLEYTGDDFEADMERMAADSTTRPGES